MAQTPLTAQLAPASTAEADLYTVAASKWIVISALTITNIVTTVCKARIIKRVAGAATSNKAHYYYDISIDPGTSFQVCAGLVLATTDVLTVKSDTANGLAFNLDGVINDV